MRKILGPFKNTNILIFKGKAATSHYWAVFQNLQGVIADHPISIEFPLCALHFKLVSLGANRKLKDAKEGALCSLKQDHFPLLSGHERMELRAMTWRALTEQERATYHFPISEGSPSLENGKRLILRNPMYL